MGGCNFSLFSMIYDALSRWLTAEECFNTGGTSSAGGGGATAEGVGGCRGCKRPSGTRIKQPGFWLIGFHWFPIGFFPFPPSH